MMVVVTMLDVGDAGGKGVVGVEVVQVPGQALTTN